MFYKCDNNFRKTQINIIPSIVLGINLSESSVSSDIVSLIQFNAVIKRIKRLFCNKIFNPYSFYDKIINYVISTYKKKHSDKRVHIIFYHMLSHDNFTVFILSMRISKQGISYVSNLFEGKFDLIFLADRWFNSTKLTEHINSLGHTYCLRLKSNIKVTYFDNLRKHNIETYTQNLSGKKFKCKYYKDISYTESNYKTNIVISDFLASNTP